jgi:hypothetical protein
MERRTFMKGAVVAAAAPGVAFAPIIAGKLAALVKQYDEVSSEADRQARLSFEIWTNAGEPFSGYVLRSELSNIYAMHAVRPRIVDRNELEGLFDHEAKTIRLNIATFNFNPARWEHRFARIEEDKRSALALFDRRRDAYDNWADESGFRAATDESGRLEAVCERLDHEILSFPMATVEDLRLKGEYLNRFYRDGLGEAAAAKLIDSLLA